MVIVYLSDEYEMKPFDCGDDDLNGFLLNDAKQYAAKKLAYTYILEDDNHIVAYYSLLNDKVSKRDASNAMWRKVKKLFPHQKHFNSYPAIKIGRFAVSKAYKGQGIGSKLMNQIKRSLMANESYSAFRFLTVDAYLSAIPFYEANGFQRLIANEENEHTRLMYFDMTRL